ncbi:YbaY family lipoprotein [Pseudomonas sp.]|uniref:YbaY family lipoprotein n=1 Tax=Pseudomonas sp. TaxID=306 RepID=UPI0026156B22|nr:YbaY family lipoprotein [Pseudomonas sp.]
MKKIALLSLTALLGACSSMAPAPKATLDGEVYYLQRIALPPTATLEVSLQDVSLADAPAVTLATQSGPVNGQVPLPFHLTYDPAQVKSGHTYAISARIEDNGQLLFITTERNSIDLNAKHLQPIRLRVNQVTQ